MMTPQTLSALVAKDEGPTMAFGVAVDAEAFSPPPWLECIALAWKADASGAIDTLLLDTIVAYTLSGVRVIIEIAPTDTVDHAALLQLAGNAGFSVSAILPTPHDSEHFEAWATHCEHFTEALLTTPNFGGDLFPITPYLSFLIAEHFAGMTAATPGDPYLLSRFREALPEAIETAGKARIRARLEDCLGGPAETRKFLAALVAPLRDEAETFLHQQAERRAAEAP